MAAKKIAFYTSGECYGGLEKNAIHYIQWLQTENFEISLITDTHSEIAKVAEAKHIHVTKLNYPGSYFSLKKTRLLKKTLITEDINCLLIIRPRDILTSSFLKVFYYRKICLIFFQQSNIRLKNHPILYRLLFRPFDAWIAPSMLIKEKMQKKTRYNPARMVVVPPCVDSEHFAKNAPTKESVRQALKLPASKIIIGSLGKYDIKRKHDFLIRAIQLLKRHNHHVDLLIMGRVSDDIEEEYYDFLQELTVECRVEDRIHFRPYPEKIITFFRAIDVFVMNWSAEPYDLLLLKAMASGVPVLSTFSEHNTELLGKGEYGILYQENDLQDLTAKLIHLTTQPKLSQHMKQAAIQRIKSDYDRVEGCQQVSGLINKLLGN